MGTATVTVPAEYAEAFCEAVLVELRHDAEWVKGDVETLQRAMLENRAEREEAAMRGKDVPDALVADMRDVEGGLRCLFEMRELADQMTEETITGTPEALAHVCQAMADKVLSPRLAGVLNYAPCDLKPEEVGQITEAITWAVNESVRLEGVWKAGLKEARV